jgi:hypothetical protein
MFYESLNLYVTEDYSGGYAPETCSMCSNFKRFSVPDMIAKVPGFRTIEEKGRRK